MNTSLNNKEGKSFIETLNILFALMCIPWLFLAMHTFYLFMADDGRGVFLWGMFVSILIYPIVALVSIIYSRKFLQTGHLQEAKIWSVVPFISMAVFALFMGLHHG